MVDCAAPATWELVKAQLILEVQVGLKNLLPSKHPHPLCTPAVKELLEQQLSALCAPLLCRSF